MENKNRITFVNNGGNWVLKGAKKSWKITSDVAQTYSQILLGLLELSIKVGLFVLLLPHITEFVTSLLKALGAM
jgi:hypothetical protein